MMECTVVSREARDNFPVNQSGRASNSSEKNLFEVGLSLILALLYINRVYYHLKFYGPTGPILCQVQMEQGTAQVSFRESIQCSYHFHSHVV